MYNISIYGALCNKRPRWAVLLTWALLKNYSETCLIRSALGEEFWIDKYSETNNTYVGFDRFKWSDKTDRVNVMSCFVFFFQLNSSTRNSISIIVSTWRGLCPSIWTNLNPFHFWFQGSCSGSGSTSLHQKFGRREKVFLSINISLPLHNLIKFEFPSPKVALQKFPVVENVKSLQMDGRTDKLNRESSDHWLRWA